MNRLGILVLTATLVACSTSDYDQPNDPPRGRPPMGGQGTYTAGRTPIGALDMLPPDDWWHQPLIAEAVNLSSEQMAALDKISRDQGDDIARLDRDTLVAVRDLRQLLDSSQPAGSDIVAAGQRIRSLRDTLFDRQLQKLADERLLLSQRQWETLQQQLQSRRSQRNQDYGPRRGGRGMGGRGRWPGF